MSAEDLSGIYKTNTKYSASYVTDDGETPYFHIQRLTTDSKYNDFAILSGNPEEPGQYLVMKYRSKSSEEEPPSGTLFAKTSEFAGAVTAKNFNYPLNDREEEPQWHVIVIDLSAHNQFLPRKPGKYLASDIVLRLFGRGWWGGNATTPAVEDYIDFAYIAMVNDLDDLKDIVSEETFDYMTKWNASEKRNTANPTVKAE